ncbi:hypothetical protein SD37_28860 [Amycolatopsis orientalis]|uniref:Peptidase S9 prolyl oligopeptidase catalytic domain-containing protein n=1 Tax=Amycolatopsis orientalis TaxID=31958 RepID=A0A193C3V1_AMYOR|nr:dienelactone hydrolase family protein [Amycolatopsis orientalis]ANN19231.1 hypothetical protein SD37_28860 [Amycolatopsis orientalis]
MRKELGGIAMAVAMATTFVVAGSAPGMAAAPDIGVTDVVQTRRISEVRTSPDGRFGAAVVTEPSVADNTVTSRILVLSLAKPAEVRTVATVTGTTGRITNLRWSPEGTSLAYLAPRDGADEIWQVPVRGGKPGKPLDFAGPAVLIGGKHEAFRLANVPPHPAKILAFEWSPDGRRLAFTTPRPGGRPTADGVVFDERTMDLRTLETGEYDLTRNGLWLLDTATGHQRHIDDFVMGPLAVPGKPGMAWSPDGSRLAFVTRESQRPTDNLDTARILDAATGRVTIVDTAGARPFPSAWSPDGRSILASKDDKLLAVPVGGGAPEPVAALPAGTRMSSSGSAWWSAAGDRVFAMASDERRESLYSAPRSGILAPATPAAGTLSGCSFDAARRQGLCVREDAATPPRLVVVDAANGTVREGHDPNAWAAGVRLTRPRAAEWTLPSGHRATGYRLVPDGCGGGNRCPAVVITHGYDATERFMAEENEWQYPSQVFAAKGYVVLLVNESRSSQDPRDAVAAMEAAVKSEVDGGFADQGRVGIMGYSRGAFVSEEAIARSTVFKAASAGEGGSPSLIPGSGQTADRVNGPVLQQAGPAAGSLTLSIHQFVKGKNVPAEFVVFGDETHVFHQPRHRAAAMNQNLGWFDRWLGS